MLKFCPSIILICSIGCDPNSSDQPRIVQKEKLGEYVSGVSINAWENILAATTSTKGKELMLAKPETYLTLTRGPHTIQTLPNK